MPNSRHSSIIPLSIINGNHNGNHNDPHSGNTTNNHDIKSINDVADEITKRTVQSSPLPLPSKRPAPGAFLVNVPNEGNTINNHGELDNNQETSSIVSLPTLPISSSDHISIDEQPLHPSEFLPDISYQQQQQRQQNKNESPRTRYMRRQSKRASRYLRYFANSTPNIEYSDDEDDDEEENHDDDDDEDNPTIEDFERGYRMSVRPDPSYLGFVPSENDNRPYLAALPLVSSQTHPQLQVCAFYLPVSFTHKILVFAFISFMLIGVATVSYFILTNEKYGINIFRN